MQKCLLSEHIVNVLKDVNWLTLPKTLRTQAFTALTGLHILHILHIQKVVTQSVSQSVNYWHAYTMIGPESDKNLQTSKCLGQSSWLMIRDNGSLETCMIWRWQDVCGQESVWQVGEDPPLLLHPPDGIHLCILWKLFPSDFFLFLAQKIFCRHCVLTVFQPFKLCYYL